MSQMDSDRTSSVPSSVLRLRVDKDQGLRSGLLVFFNFRTYNKTLKNVHMKQSCTISSMNVKARVKIGFYNYLGLHMLLVALSMIVELGPRFAEV